MSVSGTYDAYANIEADAATVGAQIGSLEESTLESAGSQVPKRQLDKIANGAGAIGDAVGAGTVADPAAAARDSIDGTLTSGAANAGAQIGNTEESTLEAAGNDVPKN